MDTKRLAIGTVVGGIAMFAVAQLIWNPSFGLSDYYYDAIGAAGVARDPPLLWVGALANVPFAGLIMLGLGGGSLPLSKGIKVGAITGFLVWLGVAPVHYGDTTIFDLTATILDPLLASVHFGVGGGAIAAVLGKLK